MEKVATEFLKFTVLFFAENCTNATKIQFFLQPKKRLENLFSGGNVSNLQQRITTSLLFASASLFLIYLGGWVFTLASIVLGGLILEEWQRLTTINKNIRTKIFIWILYIVLAVLIAKGFFSLAALFVLIACFYPLFCLLE